MFDDIRPHLVELRKRLVISVVTLIVMFFVMFAFSQELLTWLVQPLNDALISLAFRGLFIKSSIFAPLIFLPKSLAFMTFVSLKTRAQSLGINSSRLEKYV